MKKSYNDNPFYRERLNIRLEKKKKLASSKNIVAKE